VFISPSSTTEGPAAAAAAGSDVDVDVFTASFFTVDNLP